MTDLPRHLDLRISAATETGFIVWEAAELAAYHAATGNIERFPKIAGGHTAPPAPRTRRFFGR